MTDIITKDEIKEILDSLLISSLGLQDMGNCLEQPHRYIQKNITEDYANKIISKINENIKTKLDKTLKKFLMMDLERASRYAIYRDKILKRMMNDLVIKKNKI